MSFPEGIGGGDEGLYIAGNTVEFRVPRIVGTCLYAGGPIRFSHAVSVFEDGGYVTDSNGSAGHAFKFTFVNEERKIDANCSQQCDVDQSALCGSRKLRPFNTDPMGLRYEIPRPAADRSSLKCLYLVVWKST